MSTRVGDARSRRIWHAEAAAVLDALEADGAWQTALRIRVAQRDALARRPSGSAFEFRPAPEDAAPLTAALSRLRRRAGDAREHRPARSRRV
jgi:hypothetical protein